MARRSFWAAAVLAAAMSVVAWLLLPDRVPLHFDGSGDPDRWGSRVEAVITLGAVKAGMVLMFWALTAWVPRAPETLLNIPWRDKEWWLATQERRGRLNDRIVWDLNVMGALTVLFLVVVELFTIWAARHETGLGAWFWVALAVYLVAILGYAGYLVAVRYRAPRDDGDGAAAG